MLNMKVVLILLHHRQLSNEALNLNPYGTSHNVSNGKILSCCFLRLTRTVQTIDQHTGVAPALKLERDSSQTAISIPASVSHAFALRRTPSQIEEFERQPLTLFSRQLARLFSVAHSMALVRRLTTLSSSCLRAMHSSSFLSEDVSSGLDVLGNWIAPEERLERANPVGTSYQGRDKEGGVSSPTAGSGRGWRGALNHLLSSELDESLSRCSSTASTASSNVAIEVPLGAHQPPPWLAQPALGTIKAHSKPLPGRLPLTGRVLTSPLRAAASTIEQLQLSPSNVAESASRGSPATAGGVRGAFMFKRQDTPQRVDRFLGVPRRPAV